MNKEREQKTVPSLFVWKPGLSVIIIL